MKSILDPSFRYTMSFNTDIQKTFARIRRERQKSTERLTLAATSPHPGFPTVLRKAAGGPT
jgi:hypothetical protein